MSASGDAAVSRGPGAHSPPSMTRRGAFDGFSSVGKEDDVLGGAWSAIVSAASGGPDDPEQQERSSIFPPPPAAALWDAAAKDGRPVGLLHEGPFSSDSFLVGAWYFGGNFKRIDRLPSKEQNTEKTRGGYAYSEHTLFRVPDDAAFLLSSNRVGGGGEVAFPADGGFVDQLDQCKETI